MRGQRLLITHPCHPRSGQTVDVLHYRVRGENRSVLVEFADGTTQVLPLAWTDKAEPSPHPVDTPQGSRLSVPALLELASRLEQWKIPLDSNPKLR